MKKQLGKIGYGGSILTAICCLTKSSLVAFLSSVGIVFAFDDNVLIPILFLFVMIMFISLLNSFFSHKKIMPLFIAFIGVLVMSIAGFIIEETLVAYFGILLILISGIWDIHETRGCDSVCSY